MVPVGIVDFPSRRSAMRTGLSVAVAGVGIMLAAAPLLAHHAFAAEFDIQQSVTLRGTVTKMEWTNPHSWIVMDVKGADGAVTSWAIECGPPNNLLRRGFNKETIPPGTEIVVEGYRAKDGRPAANGRDVTFANGKKVFVGSGTPGAPADAAAPY
jgi:hypothetical protein